MSVIYFAIILSCQIVHIELFIDERVDRLTDLIDLCRVLMVVVVD